MREADGRIVYTNTPRRNTDTKLKEKEEELHDNHQAQ